MKELVDFSLTRKQKVSFPGIYDRTTTEPPVSEKPTESESQAEPQEEKPKKQKKPKATPAEKPKKSLGLNKSKVI